MAFSKNLNFIGFFDSSNYNLFSIYRIVKLATSYVIRKIINYHEWNSSGNFEDLQYNAEKYLLHRL